MPGYTGPSGGTCSGTLEQLWRMQNDGAITYAGSRADPVRVLVAACGLGTYKSINGSSACVSCPASSTTLAVASTAFAQCVCVAGQTGADANVCSPCAAGTYKAISANAACLACPANSNVATTGSTTIAACTCNAGFSGPNGGPCSGTVLTMVRVRTAGSHRRRA